MSLKLTVGQYQQLYAISNSDDDTAEKAIQSVCVVTGKPASEVEDMPLIEFNALNRQIVSSINSLRLGNKPVSFISGNGKLYQLNYKVSTLTAGQYTEVQYWLKDDWITSMDKIMASIAVPVKKYLWIKLPGKNDSGKHQQVCEDMQDVDFATAYGCVVFFCKVFAASIKATLPYLEPEILKTGKTKEETNRLRTDLTRVLDGYTT